MGWVVNATPRPLYPRERHGTQWIGGWVGPRAGQDGCGKSRPTGIRSPDGPARSEYRPSYPDWAIPTELSRPSYPDWAIPTELSRPSYPDRAIPTELSRPSYPNWAIPTELSRLSYPDRAIPTELSRLSYPDRAISAHIYAMGNGVKAAESCRWPTAIQRQYYEWAKLYLCSPSVPSWHVMGRPLPLRDE